jgi:hypothetical protein
MPYSIIGVAAGAVIAYIFVYHFGLLLFVPDYLLVLFAALALAVLGLIFLPIEVILRRRLGRNWRIFGIALPALLAGLLAIDYVRIGRFNSSRLTHGSLRVPFDAKKQAIQIDWDETSLNRAITGDMYAGTAISLASDRRLNVYRNFVGRSVALRSASFNMAECERHAKEMTGPWGLPAEAKLGGWSGGRCMAAYSERPDVSVVKIEIHRKNGIYFDNHLEVIRITAPDHPPLVVYGGSYWGRRDCVYSGLSGSCNGAISIIKSALGFDPTI